MYKTLKNIGLKLIPKKFLYRYENIFRYFLYLKYAGNKCDCNLCGSKLKDFIIVRENKLCPRCGSMPRTRRLWKIINDDLLIPGMKVLDFSPSRSIYRKLKKQNINYLSSDLSGDFLAEVTYDIQNIDSKNEEFDLIICFHILEHIENDTKAMKELHRILKNDGICLIQTPFKEGEIYEDYTIKDPLRRLEHFGQEDHVRVYSVDGLISRLTNVGFKVERKDYIELPDNYFGMNETETILFCRK